MSYPQDSIDTKNKYSNFLRNKKVVLVGPSYHMRGMGQGHLIDSYDIVVRVSKGYEVIRGLEGEITKDKPKNKFLIPDDIKNDLGTRMDILYQTLFSQWGSGWMAPFKKIKKHLTWLCASMPDKKHKPFIKDFIKYTNKLDLKFHIVNKNYYNKLLKKMETVPTIGPMAAIDLLRYDIKELYFTGFTFCQSRDHNNFYYYPEYFYNNAKHLMSPGGKKHDNNKIFKYFEKLYKKDSRIKCDKVLNRLMDE
jgi:hypothetical protein